MKQYYVGRRDIAIFIYPTLLSYSLSSSHLRAHPPHTYSLPHTPKQAAKRIEANDSNKQQLERVHFFNIPTNDFT